MKKITRAIHIDFHTMPGVEDFGMGFTASELAQTLQDAHVDYVNVFGRCNIGFSYYPTKIGTPYPSMQGNLLGDTIEECHKRGIGVTSYLNGGLNHQLLLERPEYARVDKDGRVMGEKRVGDNFFRSPCFNSGYREHLYEEIREMLAMEPDGIFVDCMRPTPCYCPSCIRKMKESGVDITDEQAVTDFAMDTLMEVFREIREIVPQDKRLYMNNGALYDVMGDLNSQAETECLPGGCWGYDFFPAQAPYFRMFSKDRIYMSGRFQTSWGDYAGVKPVASMENDVYDALFYGYVPSVGDHMHPRDGLNKKLYEKIGKIFAYVESLEPWTAGSEPAVEVAVIVNKFDLKLPEKPDDVQKGVCRMLAELKVGFDVVNEDMDLSKYRMVILPEGIRLTEKLVEKLTKKIQNIGCSMISCGDSLQCGGLWDYIDEFQKDTNTNGFYQIADEVFPQYCGGIKMKSSYSIADYIEPYFQNHFDGLHSYYYVPPKGYEGYSAVAVKGNRAHICFNIFDAYQKRSSSFHRELLKSLIDRLLPDRLILSEDLPVTSRASLLKGISNVLHIKVTYPEMRGVNGVVEEHNVMPAGRKVSVAGEYSKVFLLPKMQQIESCIREGRTEITLPEICGYAPFLLEK